MVQKCSIVRFQKRVPEANAIPVLDPHYPENWLDLRGPTIPPDLRDISQYNCIKPIKTHIRHLNYSNEHQMFEKRKKKKSPDNRQNYYL